MTLYIIGIGLNDEKDITLKGLEAIQKSSKVYLEIYTSKLQAPISKLEALYKKKIIPAGRELVESGQDEILKDAKTKNVAFLVIGDALSATTHIDLMHAAIEKKIKVEIIFNASVLTAVSVTGLQLYKFGRTTSIPFPDKGFRPITPYTVIEENKKNGLHTLCLLDLRPFEKKFMTVNQAIEYLLEIESSEKKNVFTKNTLCIGCARLGSKNQAIKAGKASELLKVNFGKEPHCLIIPGRLHFMEEDMLKLYR